MTESDVYLEIADRALTAADAALNGNVHEKAAFLVYHGFESAGGALCRHRSVPYPKGHRSKLNVFVAASRRERFGLHAAQLAMELAALRNLVLYPQVLGNGTIRRPVDQISPTAVERLKGRTSALVKSVRAGR